MSDGWLVRLENAHGEVGHIPRTELRTSLAV